MQPVADFLQRIHPTPHEALMPLLALWQPVSFRRGELITQAGQVERFLYFVLEGVQRSYHLRDGKEDTLAFTYPPSLCGIPESLLTRAPSPHFLECVTTSQLLRLPYDQLDAVLLASPPLERLFRKLTEQLLVGVLDRYTELLAYPMAERFRRFMLRSASLLNVVPHKHLASYLGMDPTNFSKLLRQVDSW